VVPPCQPAPDNTDEPASKRKRLSDLAAEPDAIRMAAGRQRSDPQPQLSRSPVPSLTHQAGCPKGHHPMAHRLARLVYRMLKYGQRYVDKGTECREQRFRNQQVQLRRKNATKLGFQIHRGPSRNSFLRRVSGEVLREEISAYRAERIRQLCERLPDSPAPSHPRCASIGNPQSS